MAFKDTSSNPAIAAITGQHTAAGDGVYGETSGSMPVAGVHGVGMAGRGVVGESGSAEGVLGVSRTAQGVLGSSTGSNGVQGNCGDPNASGVYGENMSGGWGIAGSTNGPGTRAGVWGDNIGNGPGVLGTGLTGVSGISSSPNGQGTTGINNAGPQAIGVRGSSTQGTGVMGETSDGIGVLGMCGGGPSPVAVRGIRQGTYGLAGQFDGNVQVNGDLQVNGTLSKSLGTFVIDHPLDPANKYLRHSFVESPDMLNIYNGIALLDASGKATVELPGWFEALNEDFRYGLTPIGGPGPNLYIAKEVDGNHFKIAGGSPGMKVSWQITGVRCDPYAVQHRVCIEEDKPERERGKYLHPKEYGMPESMGIYYDPSFQMEEKRNGHNHVKGK